MCHKDERTFERSLKIESFREFPVPEIESHRDTKKERKTKNDETNKEMS